ncbi:polymorphic toxin type 47 domain-containing protein [Pseudomonas fluorescens]|uniref:polymorphic toxin type 47 domain-containing protein n=1 Tax=Pseudomonas fluorescens TaxID=294 RepID=UPI003F4D7A36
MEKRGQIYFFVKENKSVPFSLVDDPRLVPSTDGPADPHVGYQTPGKRGTGGAVRGHILLESVPVSRARIGDPQ